MQLFVVNVGVNATDAANRGLRSPLFPDGTFEFVPIKEQQMFAECRQVPTYGELRSWTGRVSSLFAFLPVRVRTYRVHADPEFDTFTYGDVLSPRAANLATAAAGDYLWFLARLWAHDGSRWTGASDFHFIGRFEVEANIIVPAGSTQDDISPTLRERIGGNAHYRRLLCGDRSPFRVLVGRRGSSCRFERALRVTPDVAALVYGGRYDPQDGFFRRGKEVLRNVNGKERRFNTFGSATRSVQAFLNSEEPGLIGYLEALSELSAGCGKAQYQRALITRPLNEGQESCFDPGY